MLASYRIRRSIENSKYHQGNETETEIENSSLHQTAVQLHGVWTTKKDETRSIERHTVRRINGVIISK